MAGLEEASAEQIQEWVARALKGDAERMDALVAALAPVVHTRAARAMLRRKQQSRGRDLRADLEDLVQEVFAALFAREGRALRQWDPSRGLTFVGFVGFLAEREVGMLMRTGKRNPWTEDPTMDDRLVYLSGQDETTLERIESRDMLERVADRLRERLSPRGREYFRLLYVDNLSVQDTADSTGTTTQALYAWRSRLTKMLRELRNEIEAEEGRHV